MEHLGNHFQNHPQGLDLVKVLGVPPAEPKCSFHNYHQGPNGWDIGDNGTYTLSSSHGPFSCDKFTQFVQQWLYFEVLREILGHLQQFDFAHFMRRAEGKSGTQYITTRRLPDYLQWWLDHEKKAPSKQRQLRAQLVLNESRFWVTKYCAVVDGSNPPYWPIDEKVTLSIMVLGETLMSGMIRLQQLTRFKIRGWVTHEDSSPGWGCSQLVLDQLLRVLRVCPHKVSMLRSRLRNQTTGLLYASQLLRSMNSSGVSHQQCDERECKAIRSYAGGKVYQGAHFCKRGKCRKITVDLEELIRIIDKDQIPLLQYSQGNDRVEVVAKSRNEQYVTFSHVWADGYGNPEANALNQCVLNQFLDLFQIGNENSLNTSFWIDTLAIPVQHMYAAQRRKVIGKISDIFAEAQYTIVLDAGLMEMSKREGYVHPAMNITMSGWLTRVWTLQEAVVSKKLYFNFSDGVISMTDLEEFGARQAHVEHDLCLKYASSMYFPLIMKHIKSKEITSKFVAATWKALQWRTTEHRQHETLALATLFQIKKLEDFANLGDIRVPIPARNDLDRGMEKLLRHLSRLKPCSIPPGMIFLPGPRLLRKGYRWAPQSWLSLCGIDSPDPLMVQAPAATLVEPEGLRVTYPGFLLHRSSSSRGLFASDPEIGFPANQSISEWYHVERADEEEEHQDDRDLAIIALRSPVLNPKEIALLVAIRSVEKKLLRVEILHRVWIRVESDPKQIATLRAKFLNATDDDRRWGEKLPTKQKWLVDGLDPPSVIDKSPTMSQRLSNLIWRSPKP